MGFRSDRPLRRSLVKIGAQLLLGRRRAHFHNWFPGLHLTAPAAESATGVILYRGRQVGLLHHPALLRRRAGDEIVIVGSGPSVRETVISRLPDRTAILLNGAINLIATHISAPLAVAIEDERFIWRHMSTLRAKVPCETILLLSVAVIRAICEIDREFLKDRPVVLIDDLRKPYGAERRGRDTLARLPFVVVNKKHDAGISLEPCRGVFQGGSVAVSALQFAIYCEPRSVGLIGIDIANADQPRFYETIGNVASSGVARAAQRIVAHFALAKQVAETRRIALINYSRVSALVPAGFPYDDRYTAS